MSHSTNRDCVLMIAYTNYQTDPRVIREAEAAVSGGFDVDFIALRRDGEPPRELIRGVRLIHLNQTRYRGAGVLWYVLSYLQFFLRCLFMTTWLQAKKRYRVVHVNNMPDFFVFCALLPKLMGAKSHSGYSRSDAEHLCLEVQAGRKCLALQVSSLGAAGERSLCRPGPYGS